MSVRRIVKTIMTVSLMIIMFPISGCLGNATPGPTQEGPVVIRVQIPDMFRPKAKALSSFDSAVTELLFTLSKGGVTVSRSVPVNSEEVAVTFESLAVGQWRINVVGKN